MKEKKWHQNLNNASFNWATTKMFWPIVNPELGASENMVLTWPLDFCLPAYFCLKKSIFAPKLIFLINFITVLWFIWDLVLVLFESQKDVVSGKILVFGNTFGFPRVIGPKNGPKPSTLGTSETTSGRNFSKLVPYLGEKWLRKRKLPPPKKGGFVDTASPQKRLNIITWQLQMLI